MGIPNNMIRTHFIINSTCNLSKESSLAIDLCKKSSKLECSISETKSKEHAINLAHIAAVKKMDIIVAVGGDGTCNEVVNGMMNAEVLVSCFAIIPNGTGNDFHRMLGDFSAQSFVFQLERHEPQSIDLILVRIKNQTRFSLNIAGGGFDGFVVNLLNNQRKQLKIGGNISYALAILRSFFLFKKPLIQLKTETFEYNGKGLLIAACNGSTFGHGLVIHPNAKLDSGDFGVTLIGDVSLYDYVRYLKRIKKGIEIDHPQVHYLKAKKMSISTSKTELYVQCDGELMSSGEPSFEIVPDAIRLIR